MRRLYVGTVRAIVATTFFCTMQLAPAAGPIDAARPAAPPAGPASVQECGGLRPVTIQGRVFCVPDHDVAGGRAAAPDRGPAPLAAAATPAAVTCDGDGTSGNRVQVLYVHPPERDRFSDYLASFKQWMVDMDVIFDASAAETGGSRHVRFVHDAQCEVIVLPVQVSSAAMTQAVPDMMWNEVAAQGYDRTDRRYLIFADTTAYGLGTGTGFPFDDRPTPDNRNNSGPSYTSSPFSLWGGSNPAHELMHNLGAVATSAPHSTGIAHCWDEYDRMCYKDGPSAPDPQIICANPAQEQRFDCNHDDYFSTNPAPGSYLATHWNTANNSFLIGAVELEYLTRTWTGNSSTDWATAANWSPAGVPGSGENCAIPAGRPRYPNLGTTERQCFRQLTVAAGAQLTIGQNGGLAASTAIISGTVQVLDGSYFDVDTAITVESGGLLTLGRGDIGAQFTSGGELRVRGTLQVSGVFPVYGISDRAHLVVEPGGLVDIIAGGALTVDGGVTNAGTLQQIQDVPGGATTSFLSFSQIGEIQYAGVDITPVGGMGPTTVRIRGSQQCPQSASLGGSVRRCYELVPTTAQTATIRLYYRAAEQALQAMPGAYHYNGATWDALTSTRGGSGEALYVEATGVTSYSPFALKDPAITLRDLFLPLSRR